MEQGSLKSIIYKIHRQRVRDVSKLYSRTQRTLLEAFKQEKLQIASVSNQNYEPLCQVLPCVEEYDPIPLLQEEISFLIERAQLQKTSKVTNKLLHLAIFSVVRKNNISPPLN